MRVKLRYDRRLHESPTAEIFEVTGEVADGKSLELLLEAIESSEQERFVLSMADVTYINSAGFGELAELHMRCDRNSKLLYFTNLSRKVASVFETMGGLRFMNIHGSLEEVLEAMGS